MARQRLLAERKLPTTDNKDEMLFQNRCKKMPLIVNEQGLREASGEGFQGCFGQPVMAGDRLAQGFQRILWRMSARETGFSCPWKAITHAIFSNHFASIWGVFFANEFAPTGGCRSEFIREPPPYESFTISVIS
ncbi:hypothetical protein K5D56_18220 [Pseudomonas cichorii]|nr:hypothetical protein [Pseudomonas cichorii]MBX8591300.1 hypothetical protein [Pseudomonas cichorii]MBX8596735.1 hypothetical protein [Pseudomonas cichorii]MBX8616228.1 hypothetical protein [Pseudomonas cichorii]